MKKITAIVLAAGKGVRMRSSLPKVLHDLKGKPTIYYVLEELTSLNKYINQIIVVVGYKSEVVKKSIKAEFKNIEFVNQKVISGTASAVKCAKAKVKNKNVLILCGDAPLITRKTLLKFATGCLRRKSPYSFITANVDGKNELGVVLRDHAGYARIIRERNQPGIFAASKEVNSGIYFFKKSILSQILGKIQKNKKKKEYFLTDAVELLYDRGTKTKPYLVDESEEILGINSQVDLHRAGKIMQRRILDRFIAAGVKVLDAESTFIDSTAKIGKGTIIFPFTFIEKNVIIGSNCSLGPFIHLRTGTKIKDKTFLGNFIEVNRSNVGPNVIMKHFGYLGDATIKEGVNVGAGTVVANYDGRRKHKTLIGPKAFIGSDTVLVAPIRVGKSAKTGAGSVVTKNVKANAVVVGVPARPLKRKK